MMPRKASVPRCSVTAVPTAVGMFFASLAGGSHHWWRRGWCRPLHVSTLQPGVLGHTSTRCPLARQLKHAPAFIAAMRRCPSGSVGKLWQRAKSSQLLDSHAGHAFLRCISGERRLLDPAT
jgi:hypothetical protein